MTRALGELYRQERLRLAHWEEGRSLGDVLRPVFGEGPERPVLMLIGEAPGREEAKAGRPFVGKAGKQLNGLLRSARIERESVYVTNAVKYRPVKPSARGFANRTPDKNEIAAGLPLLAEEIRVLRPRWIATLGNTPLFALWSLAGLEAETVGVVHGVAREICVCGASATAYPLYHPAGAIYNRSLLPVMEGDWVRLGLLINGKEG